MVSRLNLRSESFPVKYDLDTINVRMRGVLIDHWGKNMMKL